MQHQIKVTSSPLPARVFILVFVVVVVCFVCFVAMDAAQPAPPAASAPATTTTGAPELVPRGGNPAAAGALEEISSSVQRSLALLHQLHCSVSSFTLPSQLVLLERLNGVVKELSFMHSAAQDCHIDVPIDVVRFIDEGRNPDEFTRDLINSCIERNQATKGKVDAFKLLRKHLLEEIEEAYPEETEAYRALRTASVMESRRNFQAPGLLPNGDVKVKSEN
eukprot:c21834_g1_i1 orf=63-725(+)